MISYATIAPQRRAPEKTASLDAGNALDAKTILREAVKTIKAIALEAASITDTLTDSFLDFTLPLPDFGAIEKYFEMPAGQKPESGKPFPFQLKIDEMAKARNKGDICKNAQFLLDTIVEFSMALDQAIDEIMTNEAIPAEKKAPLPEKLVAQIAKSEDALNQLIELIKARGTSSTNRR